MELQKIKTPCKNCIFADYEDDSRVGGTQIGCKLGRLDNFHKQGGDEAVVEAYDTDTIEQNDETITIDTNFFIINGRICNAYRSVHSQWADEHGDDAVSTVKEELKLKLSVLVLLEDGVTEEDIARTGESLRRQCLPPVEVHFVNYQEGIKPGRLNALLWKALGSELTWRITGIAEKDIPRGRVLDLAAAQLNAGSYYAVFLGGFRVPADFISNVHEALNERLERFSLLTPLEDGNGLVVQLGLHKHPLVYGNEPAWAEDIDNIQLAPGIQKDGTPTPPIQIFLQDISAKVQYMAKANNQPYMVKAVREVVRSL